MRGLCIGSSFRWNDKFTSKLFECESYLGLFCLLEVLSGHLCAAVENDEANAVWKSVVGTLSFEGCIGE